MTNYVGVERRRFPRIEIRRVVQGLFAPNAAMVVIDLSAGGFAMRTDAAFLVGAVHDFCVTAVHEEPVFISGRIVYSLPINAPGGAAHHITGVEFVTDNRDALSALKKVIAAHV